MILCSSRLHLSLGFFEEILSSFMAGKKLTKEQCFNMSGQWT